MVGRHFGRIWLDTENPHLLLGRGQFSDVFRGKLNGSMEVAIKRIVQENQPDPRYNQIAAINPDTQSSKRENEALRQLDHPNVIKLLHVEEHNSIKYFALELCAATLYQYCLRQYNGPMPPDAVVLLHISQSGPIPNSKGFAHRNIEPKNILISKSFPTRIILADFGLSKSVSNTSGSYSVSQDRSMNDQLCWLAAELLDNPDDQGFSEKRGSIASDIFSAGCVFYFYLTPGWHPFGSDLDSTQRNIFNGEPVLLNRKSTPRTIPIQEHDWSYDFKES
ncbi:hypothetical protein GHT06_012116 [Daphnia sinensis]|uniref:Protein kinase domain-containing protein n=1 Tax=Daphnia sinensis TaxID=1820382 RepID=A0AAD5LEB3_9CRUS|nr:hypothetical protein GHT06_012116 [Daphnia sinensis]